MKALVFSVLAFATVMSTLAAAETKIEGNLPRSADLGFKVQVKTMAKQQSLVVSEVQESSAAAQAQLSVGDTIVAVNAQAAPPQRLQTLLRRADADKAIELKVLRGQRRNSVRFTPPAQPMPEVEGFDLELGVVDTSDGSRLRTLVALPTTATEEKLPAIFFTQWVSCGSIVRHFGSRGDQLLDVLGRQLNMAILLVERASDGDSEGPGCDQLDYHRELSDYRQAFDVLAAHPKVDQGKIVIVGSSLGSTTAPLLAQAIQKDGGKVAGVAVQGGGALTYFERMLNFDRIYLERRPEVDAGEIHAEMTRRALFHTEYLLKQRSPNDIARDSVAMAQVRGDIRGMEENNHYGRPFAYHQQAAQKNFLGAWAEIDAPVLVAFTEFDQFETEHGHRLIADTINRLRPGTATFVILPGLGHSSWRFNTSIEAYADETGEYDAEPLRSTLAKWLTKVIR